MKILLWTDNHFCKNSSIVTSRGDFYSTRLENQIESLNWLNQLALDTNCDSMICLGDFFDKSVLDAEELSALTEIKWNNLPKYFIVGNHELHNTDINMNSLNALSSIGTVINEPKILFKENIEVFVLPYVTENSKLMLKEYTREGNNRIILSHNDLKGIRYGQYESKLGFDIKEIDDCCKLFINGHLHNQTQVNSKILNLGNLTGQNFSEDGFKYNHCVGILDTSTLEIDLINNPYAFYFYKIEADSEKQLNAVLSNLPVNYSIGSIKVPEKLKDFAKKECNKVFKSYRLQLIQSEHIQVETQILKIDHIDKFKTYMTEVLGNSDLVQSELNHL